LGGMLDSVTNYPLRKAVLGFFNGRADAEDLKNFLVDQAANYPRPMYYALTNLLSSHDVERVRTALSARIDPHELSREQQASFVISDVQNKKGSQRQRLAAILQYCIPGVPCIYYGDERGMNGFLDPFNRETFQEAPYDLTQDYRQLAQLRNSADALQHKTGSILLRSIARKLHGSLSSIFSAEIRFLPMNTKGYYARCSTTRSPAS
jgi:alpha-glucosidase